MIFLVLGLSADTSGQVVSTDKAVAALEAAFHISLVNLLPLALLVVFTLKKVPPFLAILGVALFAGILACFTQWDAVKAFVDDPEAGTLETAVHAVYGAMATGFVSHSGVEPVDALFSRGGMASLLTTVWLVLAAMAFAAILEHAGFLDRLLRPIVTRARTRGQLILAVNASGIGLNVTAGDQYVADVLPARMYADEFRRRGLAPEVLSRAVEDSGTVTSPLVPWNTCGAYMSGVLGVSTASYLPFCFFNLLSPILDVLYGFLGFKVATTDEVAARRDGRSRRREVAPVTTIVAALGVAQLRRRLRPRRGRVRRSGAGFGPGERRALRALARERCVGQGPRRRPGRQAAAGRRRRRGSSNGCRC